MNARYRCICFALPSRLLRRIAEKAGGEDRARLLDHIEHSSQLRGARASKAAEVAARPGASAHPSLDWHRSVFDSHGTKSLPGSPVRVEGGEPAVDVAVNQAYDNVGITLEFFAKVFSRKSLDNRAMRVDSSVHYGKGFVNAMWTGKEMLFGDGDGTNILGFSQSLDIVAHELSHGVTQHAIAGGLGEVHMNGRTELKGQAGALNESLSDVFATMAKQWHAKQSVAQANWLLGEGILAPHLGKAIRSLKDPGNPAHTYEDDDQARDMSGYVADGDVHANSGIPNHAFYLAATSMGGHSWERAGAIWYEAMHKLSSQASFADAARDTVAAASRLFGEASGEKRAVSAAWQRVKVIK